MSSKKESGAHRRKRRLAEKKDDEKSSKFMKSYLLSEKSASMSNETTYEQSTFINETYH